MQAVAPELGRPSPVAGSVPVLPSPQAGLAPVPTAGVGDTSAWLPAASIGWAVPSALCFCCSLMGSFGFFLFLTFFGPHHRVLPHSGGCLYPARWQHAWSPVCAMG